MRSYKNSDITIISGPPMAGKTEAVATIIDQEFYKKRKIFAVSLTNGATLRLASLFFEQCSEQVSNHGGNLVGGSSVGPTNSAGGW